MPQSFNISAQEQHFKRVLQYAPGMLGNIAVNFFLDRFKYQNWLGYSTAPWQKRKYSGGRNSGRAILIQSGRLRRSIRITRISGLTTVIGTDVPYAKAHNEGFKGTITQSVQAHERKVNRLGVVSRKELKTRTKVKFGKIDTGKRISVKAHTRKIKMNLPQRQFMGASPVLDKLLERKLTAELLKGLRTR